MKQALWAIENNKLEYSSEQLKEAIEKLHKRKKIFRIADSSSGSLETVRQYESNPIASTSPRCIRRRTELFRKRSRLAVRVVLAFPLHLLLLFLMFGIRPHLNQGIPSLSSRGDLFVAEITATATVTSATLVQPRSLICLWRVQPFP